MNGRPSMRRLRVRRALRLLGCDRNPMRRPVDRIQTGAALGLLALFLIIGPLVAGIAASSAWDSGQSTERHDRATRHQVMATVVAADGTGSDISARDLRPAVRLQWRAKSGAVHSAETLRLEGDRIGTRRHVWIDSAGDLTRRPRTQGQTIADTTLVGTACLTAVALPLLTCYAAIRHQLDRRRYDQWTADWARTAPLWNRRPS